MFLTGRSWFESWRVAHQHVVGMVMCYGERWMIKNPFSSCFIWSFTIPIITIRLFATLLSFKTRLFSLALIYGGPESARAICISKLVLRIWKKWHTGHGVSIWSHVELGWLPSWKNCNSDSLIQDFLVKLKHDKIDCVGSVYEWVGGILLNAIAPPLVPMAAGLAPSHLVSRSRLMII